MALRPRVGGDEIWSAPRASSPTVAASPSLSCSLAPEPVLRVPPPRRGAGSRGAPPPARPPAREPWPLCRALVPVPEPRRSLLSLPLRASPPRRICILRERLGPQSGERGGGGARQRRAGDAAAGGEREREGQREEREGERRDMMGVSEKMPRAGVSAKPATLFDFFFFVLK